MIEADESRVRTQAPPVRVVLDTQLGPITLEVNVAKAPASASAFLAYLDEGRFAPGGSFWRVVRAQDNDRGTPQIDVIQGGFNDPSLPGVVHESTAVTGLAHLDGTVSLARGAVGSATGAAFFICVGPQPALDAGGTRNSDGQGFAAFAQVVEGMDVVRRIHDLPTSTLGDGYVQGQVLDPPLRIERASRE
jgi:peptidyl-prolyl cis-trans isomerase A (cyclophilin A)